MQGAYCLTCKGKTQDLNQRIVQKPSGTWSQSTCSGCGKNKSCRAKGSSPTTREGLGLAPAGQYFIPNDPVETGVQSKGDGPPQGISNLKMGMGQSLAASGMCQGKGVNDATLERKSILGPNWNPSRPTLPQLPTVDNYQAYFPGTELPSGRAGNGFDNDKQNPIPPTSANSVNYGQPTYGNTLSRSRVVRAAENAAINGGALAALAPIAMELYGAAKASVDESPAAAKIRARLARLRQMQGSGVGGAVELTEEAGKELGLLVRQRSPEALKTARNLLKKTEAAVTSGSGMSGRGGWEDFWEGFKFGFTNPIEALELVGREIKEAISPTPKPVTPVNLDLLNRVTALSKAASTGATPAALADSLTGRGNNPFTVSMGKDMKKQKQMERKRELKDFEMRMQKEKELLMEKHRLDLENEPRMGNLGQGLLVDNLAATALDNVRESAKKRLRLSAKQESQTRTLADGRAIPYTGKGVKGKKGKKAPKKVTRLVAKSGGMVAMNSLSTSGATFGEHAFGEQNGIPQNPNVMLNISGTGVRTL
jgi:hypothetical protein